MSIPSLFETCAKKIILKSPDAIKSLPPGFIENNEEALRRAACEIFEACGDVCICQWSRLAVDQLKDPSKCGLSVLIKSVQKAVDTASPHLTPRERIEDLYLLLKLTPPIHKEGSYPCACEV